MNFKAICFPKLFLIIKRRCGASYVFFGCSQYLVCDVNVPIAHRLHSRKFHGSGIIFLFSDFLMTPKFFTLLENSIENNKNWMIKRQNESNIFKTSTENKYFFYCYCSFQAVEKNDVSQLYEQVKGLIVLKVVLGTCHYFNLKGHYVKILRVIRHKTFT